MTVTWSKVSAKVTEVWCDLELWYDLLILGYNIFAKIKEKNRQKDIQDLETNASPYHYGQYYTKNYFVGASQKNNKKNQNTFRDKSHCKTSIFDAHKIFDDPKLSQNIKISFFHCNTRMQQPLSQWLVLCVVFKFQLLSHETVLFVFHYQMWYFVIFFYFYFFLFKNIVSHKQGSDFLWHCLWFAMFYWALPIPENVVKF